jgi:hypothetical protein
MAAALKESFSPPFVKKVYNMLKDPSSEIMIA